MLAVGAIVYAAAEYSTQIASMRMHPDGTYSMFAKSDRHWDRQS